MARGIDKQITPIRALTKRWDQRVPVKWRNLTEPQLEEIANDIADELARGRMLSEICDRDSCTFPPEHVIRRWLNWRSDKYDAFKLIIRDGLESGIARMIEQIVPLADNCEPTYQQIAKARLQIAARKEYAALLMPDRYGAPTQVKIENNTEIQVGHRVLAGESRALKARKKVTNESDGD